MQAPLGAQAGPGERVRYSPAAKTVPATEGLWECITGRDSGRITARKFTRDLGRLSLMNHEYLTQEWSRIRMNTAVSID